MEGYNEVNRRNHYDPMSGESILTDDELRVAETLIFETAESKGTKDPDPAEKEEQPSFTGYQQHMQNAQNASKRAAA